MTEEAEEGEEEEVSEEEGVTGAAEGDTEAVVEGAGKTWDPLNEWNSSELSYTRLKI